MMRLRDPMHNGKPESGAAAIIWSSQISAECVGHKIDQRLLVAVTVAVYHDLHGDLGRQRRTTGQQVELPYYLQYQLVQRHRRNPQRYPGIGLGEHQQIAHHSPKAMCLMLQAAQRLIESLWVVGCTAAQHLQRPSHGGQRCAELMRYIGNKALLGVELPVHFGSRSVNVIPLIGYAA
jgi:hypothetical protein